MLRTRGTAAFSSAASPGWRRKVYEDVTQDSLPVRHISALCRYGQRHGSLVDVGTLESSVGDNTRPWATTGLENPQPTGTRQRTFKPSAGNDSRSEERRVG